MTKVSLMSLHSNLKLKIPEITAIVKVGAMREKAAASTIRFVGSSAVLSSYWRWNCLFPETSERVGSVPTIGHFTTAYYTVSAFLPFTLWAPFQPTNWAVNVSWVLQAVTVNSLPPSPMANQGLGSRETMQEPGVLPGSVLRAVPGNRCKGTSQFCLSEFEKPLSNSSSVLEIMTKFLI